MEPTDIKDEGCTKLHERHAPSLPSLEGAMSIFGGSTN